jgi:hypothetical protein
VCFAAKLCLRLSCFAEQQLWTEVADALDKRPQAERQAWQQLWTDIADTLSKSQGKTTAKKKSDTK